MTTASYEQLAGYLAYLAQDPPLPPELFIEELQEYLGESAGGVTEDQLLAVIVVEQALQQRACSVPSFADNSASANLVRAALKEALFRRVAVNLARRGLPLGMQMSDAGAARISTSDPEVRRLELPYRKVLVG